MNTENEQKFTEYEPTYFSETDLETAIRELYREAFTVSDSPDAQDLRRRLIEAEKRGLNPANVEYFTKEFARLRDKEDEPHQKQFPIVWHGIGEYGPGYIMFF